MSAFCVVQVSYLLKSKVFNIGKRIACLKDFLEEKGSNGNSNKIRIETILSSTLRGSDMSIKRQFQ